MEFLPLFIVSLGRWGWGLSFSPSPRPQPRRIRKLQRKLNTPGCCLPVFGELGHGFWRSYVLGNFIVQLARRARNIGPRPNARTVEQAVLQLAAEQNATFSRQCQAFYDRVRRYAHSPLTRFDSDDWMNDVHSYDASMCIDRLQNLQYGGDGFEDEIFEGKCTSCSSLIWADRDCKECAEFRNYLQHNGFSLIIALDCKDHIHQQKIFSGKCETCLYNEEIERYLKELRYLFPS